MSLTYLLRLPPLGRYRWQRLPFGLSVSSEIFQKRLTQALDGLANTRCIVDDIIVWGRNDAEHDANVRSVLQACKHKGISINEKKSRVGLNPFLGHIISNKGLKPDPSKIEAIQKIDPPCQRNESR